jgi:hypothetical protein
MPLTQQELCVVDAALGIACESERTDAADNKQMIGFTRNAFSASPNDRVLSGTCLMMADCDCLSLFMAHMKRVQDQQASRKMLEVLEEMNRNPMAPRRFVGESSQLVDRVVSEIARFHQLSARLFVISRCSSS